MNGSIEAKSSCRYKAEDEEKYVEVHNDLIADVGTIAIVKVEQTDRLLYPEWAVESLEEC